MYAYGKHPVAPRTTGGGNAFPRPTEHDEGAFHLYIPSDANQHQAYRLFTPIALLCPPLGFLAYLLFRSSRNELDRALGKSLFWRALTLPLVGMLFYFFIQFLLNMSPEGRLWAW